MLSILWCIAQYSHSTRTVVEYSPTKQNRTQLPGVYHATDEEALSASTTLRRTLTERTSNAYNVYRTEL